MIELQGLRFGYAADGSAGAVLDGVDLTVEEGELVLVAGRTGVGKSTLLGTFNGLVPSFTGGTLAGDVLLDGSSIVDLPPRERAAVIGYVGQDPLAGFVTDTVEEELAYGMEQLGLDGATMRRRVEETLDLLGIADLRGRDLRTLSGGQQQRVAIGAVLTMHPRLLVLDEPTSALDPTAAEEVLATITRLVHDLGVSVVIAEHRLERVVPFADRMVLVTGEGGIVDGTPAEVLRTSPVAPPIVELGRLLGWDPLPLTVRDARRRAGSDSRSSGGGRPALRAGAGTLRGGQTTPPSFLGRGASPIHARPEGPGFVPADRAPAGAACGLRASGVEVRYGAHVAVAGVDLELAPGTVTALMGRNGSGKSSLLWALQGGGPRSRGRVLVEGRETREATAAQRRGLVALVPQTASDLLYLESVAEECAAADEQAGVVAGTARKLLDELAPDVPDGQHPRDLSEGQRLSLVLAVVLAASPPVILLDEPTRGLDYPGKAVLASTLRSLAASGRSVLVSTHDVEFVAEVADDVVVLAGGEVVSAGPTGTVVAQTPAFAPQVHKILGEGWLTVGQVAAAVTG